MSVEALSYVTGEARKARRKTEIGNLRGGPKEEEERRTSWRVSGENEALDAAFVPAEREGDLADNFLSA